MKLKLLTALIFVSSASAGYHYGPATGVTHYNTGNSNTLRLGTTVHTTAAYNNPVASVAYNPVARRAVVRR